eukprot:1820851-Ditylum_brightwellii.AAC.1
MAEGVANVWGIICSVVASPSTGQRSNNSLDSGMRYLLADHASKLPPLSKVYNQDDVEEVLGPQDT